MADHESYSVPSASGPSHDQSDSMDAPQITGHLSPSEMTYKMDDAEVEQFIKLRATNGGLFSGRRNSSKLAWRTILKEMGLQGKMSFWQAMKKWDNLKKRYNEVKHPPPGASSPEWRWFQLMDDAVQGRLEGSANVLSLSSAMNSSEFLPRRKSQAKRLVVGGFRKRGKASSGSGAGGGSKAEIMVGTDDLWAGMDGTLPGVMEMEIDRQEIEQERAQLDSDRCMVDREREVLERERMVLERERAGLQREQASVERERASLERARAAVERERAELDRRTAQLDTERGRQQRQRLDLSRDRDGDREKHVGKAATGKDLSCSSSGVVETNGGTISPSEKSTEDGGLHAMQMKRQKFLDLFEKLIEKF